MTDLTQRVRDATAVRLDDDRTELHVASLRRAAAAAHEAARSSTSRWRRRLVPVVAAGALLVPGLAVAAESSLPGDALHPVKTAVERVRVVADPTVAARNRLTEVAELLALDDVEPATLRSTLADAEDAVAALQAASPDRVAELLMRLRALRSAVAERLATDPTASRPSAPPAPVEAEEPAPEEPGGIEEPGPLPSQPDAGEDAPVDPDEEPDRPGDDALEGAGEEQPDDLEGLDRDEGDRDEVVEDAEAAEETEDTEDVEDADAAQVGDGEDADAAQVGDGEDADADGGEDGTAQSNGDGREDGEEGDVDEDVADGDDGDDGDVEDGDGGEEDDSGDDDGSSDSDEAESQDAEGERLDPTTRRRPGRAAPATPLTRTGPPGAAG